MNQKKKVFIDFFSTKINFDVKNEYRYIETRKILEDLGYTIVESFGEADIIYILSSLVSGPTQRFSNLIREDFHSVERLIPQINFQNESLHSFFRLNHMLETEASIISSFMKARLYDKEVILSGYNVCMTIAIFLNLPMVVFNDNLDDRYTQFSRFQKHLYVERKCFHPVTTLFTNDKEKIVLSFNPFTFEFKNSQFKDEDYLVTSKSFINSEFYRLNVNNEKPKLEKFDDGAIASLYFYDLRTYFILDELCPEYYIETVQEIQSSSREYYKDLIKGLNI